MTLVTSIQKPSPVSTIQLEILSVTEKNLSTTMITSMEYQIPSANHVELGLAVSSNAGVRSTTVGGIIVR